ncbi:MAG: hypothetical protein AAGM22_13790 [Acidobacteriota bacterium]
MRTLYHEFESLEHLLANRLLPGGEDQPIRLVVFGGTGAVGGAAVMELCRLVLLSRGLAARSMRGEIWATGLGDKEISKFVSRLYLAFEEEARIEKLEPLRHYRIDGRIDLRFSILRLHIPSDLGERMDERLAADPSLDLPRALGDYFSEQPCPFLGFIENIEDPLHAAIVAIPLPSVATYTLTSIDTLLKQAGLDAATGHLVKKRYLTTFVRGLAVIHQRYARRVVMAHTTAVGGMYRVDGGTAEIRLGFAHSSLGKKLVDKKYFADELTQLFVDQGFDVMVTAAAIGIDAVDFRVHLPSDRAITSRLRDRVQRAEHELMPADDLDAGRILLYPSRNLAFDPPVDEIPNAPDEPTAAAPSDDLSAVDPLTAELATDEEGLEPAFEAQVADADVAAGGAVAAAGAEEDGRAGEPGAAVEATGHLSFGRGKELIVEAAIRSGENGLFSVANCVALYNVMKVAIPEELALALVRHALFGPERRRDWFQERICYYAETENCYFALRLLDSYPELVRAHHSAFAIQAYQALGSSTHQARLHELGLVMLVLRLRELADQFLDIPDDELSAALPDLDGFLWHRTRIPAFQDLLELDAGSLAEDFARLCECASMEDAGRLLGYDPRRQAVRPPGREKFLSRLATHIQRHLAIITSLGVPILYRRAHGEDRVLLGPYAAPFDAAIAEADDLPRLWRRLAEKHGTAEEDFRDWVIVNNGFVDLRPHALSSAAKEPAADLGSHVGRFESEAELVEWLSGLESGAYFTTAGLVALLYRLRRLGKSVTSRKVQLGTRETWKHLFRQDRHGRHLLSPGLIETVRMYNEGMGKITGTEALWPPWGY